MERWAGQVAIVTGASVGIGAAVAKDLVHAGLKVVGLARRANLIEDLNLTLNDAPGQLYAYECDLRDESQILAAFQWTIDNIGPISILVNNAGIIRKTSLISGATENWRVQFDVNVFALLICTREAIKSMQENQIAGHIVNINSIAGHYHVPMPVPIQNVYGATKRCVTALTEMLRHELRHAESEIRVTSVSPGMVKTEFALGFNDEAIAQGMAAIPNLEPEDVSQAVLFALACKPQVQVHEVLMHPLNEMI